VEQGLFAVRSKRKASRDGAGREVAMTTIQTTGTEAGLEANDNQVNDNQGGNQGSGSQGARPGGVEIRPGQEGPQYRRSETPKGPAIPNSTPHNPDTGTVAKQQQMHQGTPKPYAGNKHVGNKTKDGKSTRDVGDKNRNRTGSESNRESKD
jgi:hypothetical protein